MAEPPVAFGLVGAGAIAQTYVRALNGADWGQIVAVSDVREEAAAAMAENAGSVAYTDYQRMLDDARVEAVLICTPPATHNQIALGAVERRKHVLCEKPLCLTSAAARGMIEAAERAGVLLTMCSKYRFVEDVIRARSILASGVLGDLVLYQNSFCAYVDMSARWNSQPEISGGGVIIDNGTHSVDLIRFLLGPIAEIHAVAARPVQRLRVEDTAHLWVRTAEGVIGTIDLSWSLTTDRDTYVSVFGSDGTLSIGWQESSFITRRSSKPEVFGQGYDKTDALGRQLENFCDAVRGRAPLLIAPEDAVASVDVIEKAYLSLEKRRWVALDPREHRLAFGRAGAVGRF